MAESNEIYYYVIMLGDNPLAICVENDINRVMQFCQNVHGKISTQDTTKGNIKWFYKKIPFIKM